MSGTKTRTKSRGYETKKKIKKKILLGKGFLAWSTNFCDHFLAVCQSFMLSVEGLGECGAWVRMRRGSKYEIAFDTIHRLDQLAEQALALQPLQPSEDLGLAIRGVA